MPTLCVHSFTRRPTESIATFCPTGLGEPGPRPCHCDTLLALWSDAQSREARIQVDLARMEYSLPRLTRAWSHLGQQGGGIGAKGEGESQLEQDKRKIRLQVDRLKRELETVRRARATQRKNRKRTPVPNAAI